MIVRLFALLALFVSLPAQAGVFFEGVLNGVPLTIEMGLNRNRIIATADGTVHLVDLERDHVYTTQDRTIRRQRAGGMDDGASILPYKLSDWSEGPPVAGHGSRYNVLQIGETICGEVLASAWMSEFMDEVQRSIELVQRVDDRLRPTMRGECGAIPFSAFAGNGWPLLAGWRDETVFRADTLRFDYRADTGRFDLPTDWVE